MFIKHIAEEQPTRKDGQTEWMLAHSSTKGNFLLNTGPVRMDSLSGYQPTLQEEASPKNRTLKIPKPSPCVFLRSI